MNVSSYNHGEVIGGNTEQSQRACGGLRWRHIREETCGPSSSDLPRWRNRFNRRVKNGSAAILKTGSVVILKDSIEIARVDEPGAVIGELSALLDRPHTADVRILEDSQFYVADAALLEQDPIVVLYVARILARRLVAADRGLVELKTQIQAGQSPGAISKLLEKIEKTLAAFSDDAPPLTPGGSFKIDRL